MHGQESLCLSGRFEPAHVSRAVPCGLVGDLARLFAYRSVRWATDGRTARCAALSLRSVSVINRPGVCACPCNSVRKKRVAARQSRRDWTMKGRDTDMPPPNLENTQKFAVLQKYNRVNLVVPVDAPHMWHAAMESKSCKLTVLGEHYRRLVGRNRI